MNEPEFDKYSASYEELLKDPLRDRFAASSDFFFTLASGILIRDYFARRGTDSKRLRYLDVGCGKGELVTLLARDFAHTAGCDPSSGMLDSATWHRGSPAAGSRENPV